MDALIRISRWVVTVLLLQISFSAQAAPLNLELQLPQINTTYMNTNYNATTDIFSVTYGFASTISFDGVNSSNISGGSISLSANISAGGILNSGSFSVLGTSGSYNSGTLLTGDLTALGYANNGSQVLEFLFNPTGGDLSSLYGLRPGGIIFSVSGYNDADFNTAFSNTAYNGFASIAPVPVPVPAAVWLFGSGLLGLAGLARRRI